MFHNQSFLIEDLINSIASTVTGDKGVRCCKKVFKQAKTF